MIDPTLPVVDRFILERAVGSGGMGTVFAAFDPVTGTRVALKILHAGAEDVARFEREAVLLAKLDHPAIVRYIAHGNAVGGRPFLAMEWLDGEDLGRRLSRGPLEFEEVLQLLQRVSQGLSTVHKAGLVHRDIKPDNIFLVRSDVSQAKIVDFGLVRPPKSLALTASGEVLGTPGYMAPEQIRGEQPAPTADLFSIGCVLYECLTGKPAFRGGNPIAVLTKVLLDEPQPILELRPGVPPALLALVNRLMSKDARLRPQDGAELVRLVDALRLPRRPASADRLPAVVLSDAERALAAVLVVAWIADANGVVRNSSVQVDNKRLHESIAAIASQYGALVDASLGFGAVVTFPRVQQSPGDQATVAARAALAMARLPGVRASLAMVHMSGSTLGAAIERAGTAPASWPRGAVLVDDLTANLLPSRFERVGVATRLALVAERDGLDLPRTIRGRITPFVGREPEAERLFSASTSAIRVAQPSVAIVSGEAGTGKSRLRQEVLRRLGVAEPHLSMMVASGDVRTREIPFAMLGALICRAAGGVAATLPESRRRLFTRVSRSVPPNHALRVACFLGEIAGVPFDDHAVVELAAARRDRALLGDHARRAVREFLQREAELGPLCVVLEDAHEADAASLEVIAAALSAVETAPIVVWVIGRPRMLERVRSIFRGRIVEELELGALSDDGQREIARAILGNDAEEETIASVVKRAAGSPLFAEEAARLTAEAGGVAGTATFKNLLGLYEARVAELEPAARKVVRAASLVGTTFWVSIVAELVGELAAAEGGAQRSVVERVCDDLKRREWFVEHAMSRFHGERELSFRFDQMREAANRLVLPEDVVAGRAAIARWLVSRGESDPSRIADHFSAAGLDAEAVPWLLGAAERAIAFSDFSGAVTYAKRGRDAARDPVVRGELCAVLAEAHRWCGDHAAALDAAREAARLLGSGSQAPPAQAHRGQQRERWFAAMGEAASSASRMRRLDELVSAADRLYASRSPKNPSTQEVVSLARAAMLLEHAGASNRAAPIYAFLDEIAPSLKDDPLATGRVHFARAWRAQVSSDYSTYGRELAFAQGCFERAGDLKMLAHIEANRAHAALELGEFDRAVELGSSALERALSLNLSAAVALARNNLGLALGRVGRASEGIDVEREAIRAYEKMRDVRLEGASRTYLARLLVMHGALADAESEARRAVGSLEQIPLLLSQATATLAMVLLARGRPADALRHAERARDVFLAAGRCEGDPTLIYLTLAEALLAAGELDAARGAAGVALRELERAAARIDDMTMRSRFLEGIPEHARILALAR
ncbi:MAG: protein kinase [Polyangiaceae bacterium]